MQCASLVFSSVLNANHLILADYEIADKMTTRTALSKKKNSYAENAQISLHLANQFVKSTVKNLSNINADFAVQWLLGIVGAPLTSVTNAISSKTMGFTC